MITILLAEDVSSFRKLTSEALRKQGYEVLEAGDGLEAMVVAAQHPGPIHLLLTDVAMSGLNGLELAERLRCTRPEVKVLFISGYPEGIICPGLGYLRKPFGLSDLFKRIREVFARHIAGAN